MKTEPEEDRTLVITGEDLTDQESSYSAAKFILFPVMLYPENRLSRRKFKNSLIRDHIDNLPTEERVAFFRDQPEIAAEVHSKDLEYKSVIKDSITSHKRGLTGSAIVRGALCGQILIHLLSPGIGTLGKAYIEIRRCIDEAQDDLEGHYIKHDTPEKDQLRRPSDDILSKIWGEYKHVSPLWTAHYLLDIGHNIDIFNYGTALRPFLKIASFFRSELINSTIASTPTPHITAPFKVWNIINEYSRPYFSPPNVLKKSH